MKKILLLFIGISFLTLSGFSQLLSQYNGFHTPLQPTNGDTLEIAINTGLLTFVSNNNCGQLYNITDTVINSELNVNIYFDICYTAFNHSCYRNDTLKIPITQNNLQQVKLLWNVRDSLCMRLPNQIVGRDSFFLGTTNIAEKQLEKSFLISPNPVNNNLYLNNTSNTPIYQLQFYDISGKLVKETENESNVINLAELQPGIYLLRIVHSKGIETHKVFKE
jgi:hypothetical protein